MVAGDPVISREYEVEVIGTIPSVVVSLEFGWARAHLSKGAGTRSELIKYSPSRSPEISFAFRHIYIYVYRYDV